MPLSPTIGAMPSELVAEYLKAGTFGLVALTALIALFLVWRLYVRRTDEYIADLKALADKHRKEMDDLLGEFIEAGKADREDYRELIAKTTTTLEAFLHRYDKRGR